MQERSLKRRELILATAARLFARDGYDNVSTRHIAAEAHIPVGSIYQYFPNKLIILEGLRDELLTKQQELLEVIDFGNYNGDLVQFFSDLVDALVAFSKDNGLLFQALNSSSSAEARRVARKIDETILDRVEMRIKVFKPGLNDDSRRLLSQISMQLVQSILSLSFRQPPKQRKEVIDTLKGLLTHLWMNR